MSTAPRNTKHKDTYSFVTSGGIRVATDGSRLVFSASSPALTSGADTVNSADTDTIVDIERFVSTATEDDYANCVRFIRQHMPWVEKDMKTWGSDKKAWVQSNIVESFYPYLPCLNDKEIRKAKENMPVVDVTANSEGDGTTPYINRKHLHAAKIARDNNSPIPEKVFDDKLLADIAVIVYAFGPYLTHFDTHALLGNFYGTTTYPLKARMARSRKEFMQSCFGANPSHFPRELSSYDFNNLYAAHSVSTQNGVHIPADHWATIATYIHNASTSQGSINLLAEYLPFALSDKDIELTSTRLIHWLEENDIERVTDAVCLLVEVSDMPYVPTVSAKGNMVAIIQRCEEMLAQGDLYLAEQHDVYLADRAESGINTELAEKAQGKILDFHRDPDEVIDNYAIYSIRSAIELHDIGDTLEVCLKNNQAYSRQMEEGISTFSVIEKDNRQYVAQVTNGKIAQLRGYRNHLPLDDNIARIISSSL